MKRAAVQWGIGRILYSMDAVWVDIEKRGKSYVIKDGERLKLDNAYLSALKKLNLAPANASGIQSLLTPKVLPEQNASAAENPSAGTPGNGQRANPAPPVLRPSAQRQASAPAPHPPQPMPFQAPPAKAGFYTVRESKVQGGMNGSNTLVTLDTPNNKQLYAFARGVRPELKPGTRLFNVKLVTKTQDMLNHLVLLDKHRENLLERGLSEERIKENGYRSMPETEHGRKLLANLLHSHGHELLGLPGFRTYYGDWTLSGPNGFLIPVRNKDGLIQGLKIRLDDAPQPNRKYRWLSSRNLPNGTRSYSWIHVTGDRAKKRAFLTEGPLKGDVASFLAKDALFVCIGGVNALNGLTDTIFLCGSQNMFRHIG